MRRLYDSKASAHTNPPTATAPWASISLFHTKQNVVDLVFTLHWRTPLCILTPFYLIDWYHLLEILIFDIIERHANSKDFSSSQLRPRFPTCTTWITEPRMTRETWGITLFASIISWGYRRSLYFPSHFISRKCRGAVCLGTSPIGAVANAATERFSGKFNGNTCFALIFLRLQDLIDALFLGSRCCDHFDLSPSINNPNTGLMEWPQDDSIWLPITFAPPSNTHLCSFIFPMDFLAGVVTPPPSPTLSQPSNIQANSDARPRWAQSSIGTWEAHCHPEGMTYFYCKQRVCYPSCYFMLSWWCWRFG